METAWLWCASVRVSEPLRLHRDVGRKENRQAKMNNGKVMTHINIGEDSYIPFGDERRRYGSTGFVRPAP